MAKDQSFHFNKNELNVAVIGLGTIGLGLCLELAKNKITVNGIDIDSKKIDSLSRNESYIFDVKDNELQTHQGFLNFSSDYKNIKSCDVVIFCLPTSYNENTPDLNLLISSIKSALEFFKKSALVIIESTLYPGAIQKEILPLLKDFSLGNDLFFSHSPERIDPGNKKYSLSNITKIISGKTPDCLARAISFYSLFLTKLHPVSSLETAEMTKVFENYFKALNISMVNEVRPICEKLGIDIHEVIKAANSKEFGFFPHYPGPGIGGRCIPMSPVYMKHAAKENNCSHEIIDSAIFVNKKTIHETALKISSLALKIKADARILLLGMAYKKNINDFRESTAVEILKDLKSMQNTHFQISVCDPYLNPFEEFYGLPVLQTSELHHSKLQEFDLVVLLMDHDEFNQTDLKNHSTFLSFK